jgi:predicted ATP-dependent serine protease
MNTAFLGELGLGGEIRQVPGMELMVKEGSRLGLKRIYAPISKLPKSRKSSTEIVQVKTIFDIIENIRSMNIFD